MSTNRYAAVLKAPDSDQRRETYVTAADEAEAREILLARQAKDLAYSLDADEARAETLSNGDGLVRLGLNEREYDAVLRDYRFDDNGKVVFTGSGSGDKRLRGKLAQHHQKTPFTVVSLDLVDPDEERCRALVAEATRLSQGNSTLWQKALEDLRAKGVPLNAVTAALNGQTFKNFFSGANVWDWDTNTFKVMLATSFTADVDNNDFINDFTTEVTGTGYTAGGATLTNSAPTYDSTTDQVRCDGADTSWTTSTISATDAAVYHDSAGAASADPFIASIDFGATVSTTAGTFQITWDSTGIVVLDLT